MQLTKVVKPRTLTRGKPDRESSVRAPACADAASRARSVTSGEFSSRNEVHETPDRRAACTASY